MHALVGGSGCGLRRRRWGRNGGRARGVTPLGDRLRRPNRRRPDLIAPPSEAAGPHRAEGGRRRRSDGPSLPEPKPARSRAKQASGKIALGFNRKMEIKEFLK